MSNYRRISVLASLVSLLVTAGCVQDAPPDDGGTPPDPEPARYWELTSTDELTGFLAGEPVDIQFTVEGESDGLEFALGDGTLPTGLSLNAAGRLTGVPVAAERWAAGIETASDSPPVASARSARAASSAAPLSGGTSYNVWGGVDISVPIPDDITIHNYPSRGELQLNTYAVDKQISLQITLRSDGTATAVDDNARVDAYNALRPDVSPNAVWVPAPSSGIWRRSPDTCAMEAVDLTSPGFPTVAFDTGLTSQCQIRTSGDGSVVAAIDNASDQLWIGVVGTGDTTTIPIPAGLGLPKNLLVDGDGSHALVIHSPTSFEQGATFLFDLKTGEALDLTPAISQPGRRCGLLQRSDFDGTQLPLACARLNPGTTTPMWTFGRFDIASGNFTVLSTHTGWSWLVVNDNSLLVSSDGSLLYATTRDDTFTGQSDGEAVTATLNEYAMAPGFPARTLLTAQRRWSSGSGPGGIVGFTGFGFIPQVHRPG